MADVDSLVHQWVEEIDVVEGDVLDLACGSGQNGLFVARRDQEHGRRNRNVVLLDRNIAEAVRCTAELPRSAMDRVKHLEVDLETKENPSPLPTEAFGAALVFRYLHRPLMPNLRNSIKPGGLVLYETYTWEHPYLGGRPRNPAFLLGSCELKEMFPGWEVLHFFEGTEGRTRAVSRIVCRKPAASILPASSSCSPSS